MFLVIFADMQANIIVLEDVLQETLSCSTPHRHENNFTELQFHTPVQHDIQSTFGHDQGPLLLLER
jgi:hypothetical protein